MRLLTYLLILTFLTSCTTIEVTKEVVKVGNVVKEKVVEQFEKEEVEIVEDKTVEIEKPKTSKKQEGNQLNFFKLLLVFIISFVAFILIVDTFIVQISEYIPFAEKYLDNLYQSIIDISLFFQNLIK